MIQITHDSHSSLTGRAQTFPGDRVRIGRKPENDVVFDAQRDRQVSGRHAEIRVEGGAVVVADVGSQNGTWVNGARIDAPMPIGPDDVVRLGEDGPALRASLLDAAAGPGGKKFIGQATLHKAIRSATAEERTRTTRRLLLLVALVAVAGGGGTWAYLERERARRAEAAELKTEVAGTKGALDALQAQIAQSLQEEMTRFESELDGVRGKLGEGESEVARLIVELGKRDRSIQLLRARHDLTERNREQAVKETESRIEGIREELSRAQDELRKKAAAAVDWAEIAEKNQRCVYLVYSRELIVGKGTATGTGTAFCVRSDGLLATNAHVAEPLDRAMEKLVVQSGTGRIFSIRRHVHDARWNKTAECPDVGLIQIDPEGETLPTVELASDDELRRVRIGLHIATLGYPGELSPSYWSQMDRAAKRAPTAMATFKDGWIGRITDYSRAAADFESGRFFQHSASTTGGTSGSPIFNSDGKVIAVHNSGLVMKFLTKSQEEEQGVSPAEIAFGIRVDELRQLMAETGW